MLKTLKMIAMVDNGTQRTPATLHSTVSSITRDMVGSNNGKVDTRAYKSQCMPLTVSSTQNRQLFVSMETMLHNISLKVSVMGNGNLLPSLQSDFASIVEFYNRL